MAEEGAARRWRLIMADDPLNPTPPEQLAADEKAQKYADETRAADKLRRSREEATKKVKAQNNRLSTPSYVPYR
jgi:hypothetical protein